MYYSCRCLKVLSPLADNCVYLLQQLQLHVWMLFEQQQHEEEADGQSVWCCDHHLQHTLPHILCRQFAVVLKTHTSTSGLEEVLSIYKKKKKKGNGVYSILKLTCANMSSAVKLMLSSLSACSISLLFCSTRLSMASCSSWLGDNRYITLECKTQFSQNTYTRAMYKMTHAAALCLW